jgi:hypothetical protein
MYSEDTSAALQRQMRTLRRDLNQHADQMVEKARSQFDWRQWVARNPWISLGAAAAAGFMLAPRRSCCKNVDFGKLKESLQASLAERSTEAPPTPSAFSTILSGALTAIATTLVREGVSFASRSAQQWLRSNVTTNGESHDPNEL